MAIVLDLQGARTADILAGSSPLAELMACLHSLAEPEHHPEKRPWLAQVRSDLTADLRVQLAYYSPLWARYRCRLFFPLDGPLNRTMADEFHTLRTLPAERFLSLAVMAVHGSAFDTAELLADDLRRSAYLKACDRRSFSRGELARALLADPEAVRAGLLETLERCVDEFFAVEWRRVQHRLDDGAARVRDRLTTVPLATVLASLSPTATVRERPLRVSYDKLQTETAAVRRRRCLLVPSMHSWPHLIIKLDQDLPIVVHYPIESSERAGQQQLSLVRARLGVLTDPARLALCRHLVNEPITTSELAQRTGSSLPQVSRHLRRLREVQLVSSERHGRLVYHRLDTQRLIRLGVDLLTTIIR